MAGIPLGSILEALGARRAAGASGRREVRAAVMVCDGASRALAGAVKAGMRPQTAGARLHVEGFSAGAPAPAVNSLCDFALVLAGDAACAPACARLWRGFASVGVPCAVAGCYEGQPDARAAGEALRAEGVAAPDALLGTDPAAVVGAVGAWAVGALPDEAADAAAAGFPCCRDARARALVAQASRDNALAGVLGLLPGSSADMVVMTTAQAVMVIRLAALYGRPLDASLARELAPVVLGAPAWRGLARALVRRLPLPGLVVRCGVGAGATAAIGRAAIAALGSPAPAAEGGVR